MRRCAAKGLSLLIKKSCSNSSFSSNKVFLSKQINGFHQYIHDEQQWKHYCETLKDDKLRKIAIDIGLCF
jgi:hypothetical protein